MNGKNTKELFTKNLNRLLSENNKTQLDLAKFLGVSNTTVNNYVKGYNAPRMDKIDKIAQFFNVNRSELINDPVDLSKIPGIKLVKNLVEVPILGHIQCGLPVFAEENYLGYFKLDPDLCKADFSLIADGDSMIDANIYEGDIVFFKKTPDVESGTIAAVLLEDEATLKKVIKTDNAVILQPENDAYNPIIVHKDDYININILGSMVGVFSQRDK